MVFGLAAICQILPGRAGIQGVLQPKQHAEWHWHQPMPPMAHMFLLSLDLFYTKEDLLLDWSSSTQQFYSVLTISQK